MSTIIEKKKIWLPITQLGFWDLAKIVSNRKSFPEYSTSELWGVARTIKENISLKYVCFVHVQDYIFRGLANILNNHVSSFKGSFFDYLLRVRIKVWYFRASGQNPLLVKFLFLIKSSGFWSSWARFLWVCEENNLLIEENRYQWSFYDTTQGWLMPWISTFAVIVSNETKFFVCFFILSGTFTERRGTTDLPIDLLQITFHFFLQDSEMKFWKSVTLLSHCHRLSARLASRWGCCRAMVIIGRMVVRALSLRSTTCPRRKKFRTVWG